MVASPVKPKRLRPGIDSPSKGLNLSWVPDGMDSSSALRIAVRVPGHVSHGASDFQVIVDRDTLNLKDLIDEIAKKLACGTNQGFNLTFYDKHTKCYPILTDAALMKATENYWELRRLPSFVQFYDTVVVPYSQSVSFENDAVASVQHPLLVVDDGQTNDAGHDMRQVESVSLEDSDFDDSSDSVDSSDSADSSDPADSDNAKNEKRRKKTDDDDVPWEEADEEYVGINDESQYMADQAVDGQDDEPADSWRHTVDLENREYSCQRWQITGLPCTHALCLICSMRNRSVEDYVHDYYSVAIFKKAYEHVVQPMADRSQWPQVDMGFKLWPPRFKRPAGHPRTRRMKGSEEGGKKTRQVQCRRCGQFGHMMKTCNETVYDSDAPPPAPPKLNRVRTNKTIGTTITISTQRSQIKGHQSLTVATTAQSTGLTATAALTNSPAANTRSQKRALEVDAHSISPTSELPQRKKVLATKTIKTTKKLAAQDVHNKRVSKKKLIMDL